MCLAGGIVCQRRAVVLGRHTVSFFLLLIAMMTTAVIVRAHTFPSSLVGFQVTNLVWEPRRLNMLRWGEVWALRYNRRCSRAYKTGAMQRRTRKAGTAATFTTAGPGHPTSFRQITVCQNTFFCKSWLILQRGGAAGVRATTQRCVRRLARVRRGKTTAARFQKQTASPTAVCACAARRRRRCHASMTAHACAIKVDRGLRCRALRPRSSFALLMPCARAADSRAAAVPA